MPDENTFNSHDSDPADSADLQGLLFESSPYGNVDAIIQHDERTTYFYLNGDETFGTRAVWIRNIAEAPYVINQEELAAGLPPMMPRTHCRNPNGLPVPNAESLKVVWLEEGSGAALFEDGELIAVIPPWSGIDGFHGYSAECTAESPLAWPLPDHDQLRLRINNAYEFWKSCENEDGHPYSILQPMILAAYDQHFDHQEEYFAIDGGRFPPRGAVAFRFNDQLIIASIGMSMRPQPGTEMAVEHPSQYRRIEMALMIPTEKLVHELQDVLKQFSGLVAWPWDGFTWFGEGHTCEISALADVIAEHPTTMQFSKTPPAGIPEIQLPAFRGDPVNLLWLVAEKSV